MFSFILHADFMLFQSPENMSVRINFFVYMDGNYHGILFMLRSCIQWFLCFVALYTRVYKLTWFETRRHWQRCNMDFLQHLIMNISCHNACFLRGPLFYFSLLLWWKITPKQSLEDGQNSRQIWENHTGHPINGYGVICDLPKGIHSENKIENSIDKT